MAVPTESLMVNGNQPVFCPVCKKPLMLSFTVQLCPYCGYNSNKSCRGCGS